LKIKIIFFYISVYKRNFLCYSADRTEKSNAKSFFSEEKGEEQRKVQAVSLRTITKKERYNPMDPEQYFFLRENLS
jgi:hypothetical protein